MQDGIIKGTGNSRKLKSAITEATTWEQFRAALIAGTLPIDLAGINSAGWQQMATALSKGNLLSDTTAALINTLVGSTPSTPDAALSAITGKTQTLYNGRVQIATGSYTGTGTYGSSNKNSLILNFAPRFIAIHGKGQQAKMGTVLLVDGAAAAYEHYCFDITGISGWGTNTISWYSATDAHSQANSSGAIYKFVAIG